uniref:beta-lactamase n=1 Tax=Paulinella chromatophora TaxID=39717 RepID=B1X4J9_PAUCH|nr:Putative penicillin-binding protein [Paulinella chromatophora]ACB42868.1 Putative penicillin-binding protein [Paulinella chromatophora]
MPIFFPLFKPRLTGVSNQGSFLLSFVVLACGAIISRLIWLQILHGSMYKFTVYQSRTRLVPRAPIRGRLLDRNGAILASNLLLYNLYLKPKFRNSSNWPSLRNRLATLLQVSPEELDKRCQEEAKTSPYRFNLAKELSTKQILTFFERIKDFEGTEMDTEAKRLYPHGSLGAHVLGYVGSVAAEEYSYLKTKGYHLDDRIGRSGIELACEKLLRGSWGLQKFEVNALGVVQRKLEDKPALAGKDVKLTIDLELQKVAEKALTRVQAGAIVAMDPQTGAIRAMVSRPNYNPNVFAIAPSQIEWRHLNSDGAPLLNRVLQGFPPASTFKIVATIAALESGRYAPEDLELSSRSFCYQGKCYSDHVAIGFIPFPVALALSSNTVFYRVGLRLGFEELFKTAHRVGYGTQTGIEVKLEESPGLIGDPGFKAKHFGQPWTSVDTIVSAIGQGMVEVTPLQMARLYCIVANGGWLVTPHLIEKPTRRQSLGLKPETLGTLRNGLRKVVTMGTASVLNDPSLPAVAGKTGTAENPPHRDHAWFGGYAPNHSPSLVVIIFCENSGGFGGTVAAPMAKDLFKTWFQVRPWY